MMDALQTLAAYKVTIIQAPHGFGKTTALKQFFYRSRYEFQWIDLRKRKLHKAVSSEKLKDDLFLVLDHVSTEDLKEIALHRIIQTKGEHHIVLICSEMVPSFFMQVLRRVDYQKIETVNFHFNLKDIRHLVKTYHLSMSEEEIHKIHEYSGGWIKVIKILLEDYAILGHIRITDRYKDMIEEEVYVKLNGKLQLNLCFLSELKEISIDRLRYFEDPGRILNFLRKLSSFGWLVTYDEEKSVYVFTTPFKAFLAEKKVEYGLDPTEFYLQFAQHYEGERNYLEAIRFYLKAGDFDNILDLIESYPTANFSDYDAVLMKQVYNAIPRNMLKEHPYVYLHMIHDYLFSYHDTVWGSELLKRFQKLLEDDVYKEEDRALYQGEVYLIQGFACFNDLMKMYMYFDKAHKLLSPNVSRIANNRMITTFGCPHILFLYHHERGKMAAIAATMYTYINCYYEITDFSGVGIAQEADAEYHLERGDYKEGESMALEAYYKAKDFSQNCVAVAALMTIGRSSLLMYKKDMYMYVINALQAEREKASVDLLRGQIDCALAYLYVLNNDLGLIAEWLQRGRRQYLLNEANTYVYIIHGMILIRHKQFFRLKVIADILSKIYVYRKHLFGDIYANLFKTIAFHNLGNEEEANAHFDELICIASADMIVLPLVECSQYLEPFIKKAAPTAYIRLLRAKINEKQFRWRISVFSEREQEIIQFINAGFTRKKTAEKMNLKENTVNTYMKRIYKKADVTNKDDLKDFCNRI